MPAAKPRLVTPMRNCPTCKCYNEVSNTCTAPNAEKVATFFYTPDRDCTLYKYDNHKAVAAREA